MSKEKNGQKAKRILVIGDMHCGHVFGLTPPDWWWDENTANDYQQKIAKYQRWAWNEYNAALKLMGPYDRMIVMGDCIDGKGTKSGGTELLTADRTAQADMAAECIKAASVARIAMVYGTPYHSGADEEWEDIVAEKVKADEIGHKIYPEINGVTMDVRHFVGNSQVPTGEATAISRAQVSNDQWVRKHENHPRANIFLRGHTHSCLIVKKRGTLSVKTPGLQGWTKFGASKCDMPIDFGIVAIDITETGMFSCTDYTVELGQFAHTLKW